MTIKKTILTLAVLTMFTACAGLDKWSKPDTENLIFLDGTVQSVAGNRVWLTLKVPEIKKTPGSPISDIAQQVVQKSLIFEGITTEVNGRKALVKETRGTAVNIELEEPLGLAPGTVIKLQVPKKSIAIVDFEVIRGNVKEAGRVTLEELTNAIVESGQFIVVERSKLKAIMNELQLSLSGLTSEKPDQAVGKLLMADLLLTGTLADMQNEWDINLRLLNVRTGQIVGAIAMKTKLFSPLALRDSGSWNEDFEDSVFNTSWKVGYHKIGGPQNSSFYEALKDDGNGAEGSQKSLRIDFEFSWSKQNLLAVVTNIKARDLSLYSGIEFYVRATGKMSGYCNLGISRPDIPTVIDKWFGVYEADTGWQKIRIPFQQMSINRSRMIKDTAKTGTVAPIMYLNRIENIAFSFESRATKEPKGSMWIDRISFYRD